nr:MAG TPA: hypothetical protein [Caudoviricetes sp.]
MWIFYRSTLVRLKSLRRFHFLHMHHSLRILILGKFWGKS